MFRSSYQSRSSYHSSYRSRLSQVVYRMFLSCFRVLSVQDILFRRENYAAWAAISRRAAKELNLPLPALTPTADPGSQVTTWWDLGLAQSPPSLRIKLKPNHLAASILWCFPLHQPLTSLPTVEVTKNPKNKRRRRLQLNLPGNRPPLPLPVQPTRRSSQLQLATDHHRSSMVMAESAVKKAMKGMYLPPLRLKDLPREPLSQGSARRILRSRRRDLKVLNADPYTENSLSSRAFSAVYGREIDDAEVAHAPAAPRRVSLVEVPSHISNQEAKERRAVTSSLRHALTSRLAGQRQGIVMGQGGAEAMVEAMMKEQARRRMLQQRLRVQEDIFKRGGDVEEMEELLRLQERRQRKMVEAESSVSSLSMTESIMVSRQRLAPDI